MAVNPLAANLLVESDLPSPVPTHGYFLALFTCGWRGEYILDFSQAPNGEPNDLNHTESQFLLQTGDDLEIRHRKPNGCGFELVILHHCFFLQPCKLRVVADEQ